MSAAAVERAREPWGFPEAVVFVAGISTLGAEIAAARLIAPAFGASTVVWANTIAVVLVALAGGYWLGGRLADRHPHARGLALTGAARRGAGRADPAAGDPAAGRRPRTRSASSPARCWCCSCWSAPPVLVLGALSPWAIRLRMRSVDARRRRHRPAVRARHRGRAGRQLRRDARADPVGGHALDVPDLRGAAGRGVRPGGMVLQACLNGDRETGVPRSPAELAADGARVRGRRRGLAARPPARPRRQRVARPGATSPPPCSAMRAAAPRVELSLSTGLWITGGDVDARARGDLRAGRSGPTSSR